jgi:hypothetical protein
VPDGKPTTEADEIRSSLVPLRKLNGHTPAASFGPRALVAVRQEMIGLGWCRTLINRRVERVRRAFRWAASQELVPVTVYQALRTVPGLQKGRTDARVRAGQAGGQRDGGRDAAAPEPPRPRNGGWVAVGEGGDSAREVLVGGDVEVDGV